MPYYSVRIAGGGEESRAIANDLRETFRGKPADYTGHPIFYVKNHRKLADFEKLVRSVVHGDYEVEVKRINKASYEWEKHQ